MFTRTLRMLLALVLLILAGCASLRDRPLVEPTVGESTMPPASPTPIPATPTIKSQTAEGDRLPGKAIRSKVERITSPEVKGGELQALVGAIMPLPLICITQCAGQVAISFTLHTASLWRWQ